MKYDINDVLNKEDTYSMTLMLLYASTDNPRYSTLSELAYILDHDNFLNFIKYFEGQTIQIPTLSEVSDNLKLLTLFQYYTIEKIDWHEALEKAGFSLDETATARIKLNAFINQLERYDYKLGGLLK